ADMIIDEVQKNDGWGANITISDERDCLLDTGGGVKKVVNGVSEHSNKGTMDGEPLLVCNVDILSNIHITDVLTAASSLKDEQGGLLVVSDRPTQRYLCFDDSNRLCGWTNTATGEVRGTDGRHLAYSGMAVLKPSLFPYFEEVALDKGDKFSLIDVYLQTVSRSSGALYAYTPSEYKMMDVGKIDQIEQAERFAQSMCTISQ
ncbi:MAG: nucleotidyltransferase family protein, partial [Paludibacteraceae bacterium]|nr:nucleotidyltransferase family protein [Paludibacteraceae bacterium]